MSKITQALEKAARERLKREQEQATAPAGPITVPLAAADASAADAVAQIQIDPHIVSAGDPHSPIAEEYRMLRTNLQSLRPRAGLKTIVVTSAVMGEGKSVTALNLALTVARQEGLKVLLVDGDLRRSSVHRWLGLNEPPSGLSTALLNGGALNGSLIRLKSPSLTVLPAGPTPESPAELLESVGMRRLLATLKVQFDLVIIDSPPVLSVSDPCILAALADGVLLVVKSGKTQRKTVLEAQARLQQMKVALLGCVLTHVERPMTSYYRYYRDYKHEKPADASPLPPTVR